MKAKLYVCVFLTALIAVFTISGCTEESTMVDKLAASTDEVIANVIENVLDETGTTTTAVTTTVAPTETTVGETTTAPEATTEAEEVAETKTNQTSDKATASNADKTENNASTQKPNNTSNSNTSGNTNGNTTGNTTTNKPSSNTNGNTSGNTSKPKPVETQVPTTEAPVVITDDTPLTFEQMNTPENMQKMVDAINAYFETLGMTYNEELDPSWAGWYYGWQGGLNVFAERTLEENIQRDISSLKRQVDAILIDYDGYEYTDITYKTVYVVNELDGYYDIVFCYG